MAKLLPTRLPQAQGPEVTVDTFNRLIRILDVTKGYTNTELGELQFATGSIIFNTTTEVHQAFDGTEFRNLYEHQTYVTGVSATMSIGAVTVTIG